jgi:acetyl-CoA carboxylase carboxyltransferase component
MAEDMSKAESKLHELELQRAKILKHGGDDKVESQHAKGKKSARERIALLLDEGSFVEYGAFVKTRSTYYGLDKMDLPADGVVTGVGTVNGRKVAVYDTWRLTGRGSRTEDRQDAGPGARGRHTMRGDA